MPIEIIYMFDQPLYMKASDNIAASDDLINGFVWLGGFHLLMSCMSSVGCIMTGSGLEELWESVYAKGSVVHMMSVMPIHVHYVHTF